MNFEEFSRPLSVNPEKLKIVGLELRQQLLAGNLNKHQLLNSLLPYFREHTTTWTPDELDIVVDGLLGIDSTPDKARPRGNDMYSYQPLPARIVLEMVRSLNLSSEDIFYDFGSGIGRINLLVAVLTEAQSKGIEFQPTYIDYANKKAKELGLAKASFIEGDVGNLDFSDGTVFCMPNSFTGETLRTVLQKLRLLGAQRRIRVAASGVCTYDIQQQTWLISVGTNNREMLSLFESKELD